MINELVGKVVVTIENKDNTELIFTCSTGEKYRMYHEQDCCETVMIEDINGDLDDLLGEITMAEEVSNYQPISEQDINRTKESESCTWTFYKLATVKGYVDIRWFGESNGWYSESVTFEKILQ